MLGIPIAIWLWVYAIGFATGTALTAAPIPWPLRSLGLFMMAAAALGALVAIEFVRSYDARRWRKWRVRAWRVLRRFAPRPRQAQLAEA